MASNRIVYTLDFKANMQDVQTQLNTLRQSLQSVAVPATFGTTMSADLKKASNAALQLQQHLKRALDPSTGKLDLSRLQIQLKAAGQSASQMGRDLLLSGQNGVQAFMNLGVAINNAQKPMHRFSTLARSLGQTLMNTVKWQISSRLLYGFIGAFSSSLNYVKDLNKSLTQIRTITGESKESMREFAEYANQTAKNLSTSTNEVSKAVLIFRQQGDTMAEASKKAEITIKAANAAGTEAKEMSEYLTGIWNSYQVGSTHLEEFADKLVRVGAVTATSSEELATSMTKVAATANAVGVTYDQLLGTISTVTAATRLSAEQVGTAFKTIYARMGDLELKGSIDEDGVTTTLGSVSSQLKQVGVDVLDANGNIKDMGVVVEDLGAKWKSMNTNQKTAIAEAVAGKRQYTQLFALFENWDEYKRAVDEAADAQGELNAQQLRFADSIAGAQARFKAAKENLISEGFSQDVIQGFYDVLAGLTQAVDDAIEGLGGVGNILLSVGSIMLTKFAPQIGQSLTNMWAGFISSVGAGQSRAAALRSEMNKLYAEMREDPLIKTNESATEMVRLLESANKIELDRIENGKKYTATMNEQLKIIKEVGMTNAMRANENYQIARDTTDTTIRENLTMGANSPRMTRILDNENNQKALQAAGFKEASTDIRTYIDELNRGQGSQEDFNKKVSALAGILGVNESAIHEIIGVYSEEYSSLETLKGEVNKVVEAHERFLSTSEKKPKFDYSEAKTKLKQLKQELEEVKKAQESSATVSSRKSVSKSMPGISKKMRRNAAMGDQGAKTISTAMTSVKNGQFNTSEIEAALKELEGKTDKFSQTIRQKLQDALKLSPETFKQDADKIQAEIDETAQKIAQLKQQKFENLMKGIGGLSSAMMGVSMAASSWKQIWAEDATAMERVMGVAMLLTSVTTTLNGVKALGTFLTENQTLANWKKILSDHAETAATGGKTVATWAYNAALDVMETLTGNVSGLGVILTGVLIAGTAALIAFAGGADKGEKQLKKFKKAQEELKTIDENISRIEEEQSALLKLQETMANCDKSVESLAQVENELNEVLGTQFDLVNGGASEYERANAMLQERIKLSREELEIEKEKRAENFAVQSGNLTAKSTGSFWKASTSDNITHEDMQALLRNIKSKDEDYEKNFFAGEYGTETLEAGSAGLELFDPATVQEYKSKLKEITTEQLNEAFRNIDSPIQSDMKQILTDMRLNGATDEEMSKAMETYMENAEALSKAYTQGDAEKAETIMQDIKKSIPSNMTEVQKTMTKTAKNIQNQIKVANEKEQEYKDKYSATAMRNALKTWSENSEKRNDIIEDFSKNGYLSSDSVAKATEMLASKFSKEEQDQIKNYLSSAEVSGEGIRLIFDEILKRQVLNNQEFRDALLQGEDAVAKQILRDSGLENADEIVDRYKGLYDALLKISIDIKGINGVENMEEVNNALSELTSQYGYTTEAAQALIIQETVFNNNALTSIPSKIAALKEYAQAFYQTSDATMYDYINTLSPNNMTVKWSELTAQEQEHYKSIGYTTGKNDEIINPFGDEVEDGVEFDVVKTKFYYQSQYDLQSNYVNQTKEQLNKLNKEHQKALADWEKENVLEKIKDGILELEEALEQFNRKTQSLDFVESLFEDNISVEHYIQKIGLFKDQTTQAMNNWNELMSMNADTGEGMEEISQAKQNTWEAWKESILNAKEAEEQLYEAQIQLSEDASESFTSVIEKQHELISITLDGMSKLLELNEKSGSKIAKKGALASMIGQVMGALSDYKKELKEQERAQKKRLELRSEETQQILEMNQRMEDEINKYALDALKQGIVDRQAERDLERQEIIKDYNDTVAKLEARMKEASIKIEEYFKPIIEEINSVLLGASKDNTTLTKSFDKATDANYDPLLKGKSEIYSIDKENNTIKIQNWDKDNKDSRVYTYKFNEGSEIQNFSKGDLIESGTILAKNSTGYEITKDSNIKANQDDYGDIISDTERTRFNKKVNYYTIDKIIKTDTGYDIYLKESGSKLPLMSSIVGHKKPKVNKQNEVITSLTDKEGTTKIEVGATYDIGTYNEKEKIIRGYAKGVDSTPAGEAWVGELGRELIILPDGKVVMAGEDGIELANLPAGARVLTNEETEKILKDKKDYTNVQESEVGFAQGTSNSTLQSQDFVLQTGDLTSEFHQEELQKQEEQNQAIKQSLQERDKEIETEDKKHHENLLVTEKNYNTKVETAAKNSTDIIKLNAASTNATLVTGAGLTKEKIESTINDMQFTLPEIDSEKFIESIDKAIKETFDTVNAERDEKGNKTGGSDKKSGPGGPLEETKQLQGTGKVSGFDIGIGKGITTYDEWFTRYGKQYGVPPEMLKGMAAMESSLGTNKTAMTKNNDYNCGGLMQFMDSTAKSRGVNKWDPEDSIRGAAEYMSDLYRTYGTWEKALTAYSGNANRSTDNDYVNKLKEALGEDFIGGTAQYTGSFADMLTKIALFGIDSLFTPNSLPTKLTKEQLAMYGAKNGWIDPVPNKPSVISAYGWRIHPITKKRTFHEGLDLAAPEGDIIVAPRQGTVVTNAYQEGGAGHYITIDFGNGYTGTFMHMKEKSPLSVGTSVSQSQPIGFVGATGGVTGPHLHYEIAVNGKEVDARPFLSYAKGGTTKGGKALVGEYGKEIILYPDGTAGILGENGMEYAELPAGAQIIPAEETAKILGNPVDKRIPAYANGTIDSRKADPNMLFFQQYLKEKVGNTVYKPTGYYDTSTEKMYEQAKKLGYTTGTIEEYLNEIISEAGYLRITLSPEDIAHLKVNREEFVQSKNDTNKVEVTPQFLMDMQKLAVDNNYPTIRDSVTHFYGNSEVIRRDYKNFGANQGYTVNTEASYAEKAAYIAHFLNSDEIKYLKSQRGIVEKNKNKKMSDTITKEFIDLIEAEGYSTLRDNLISIYGDEKIINKEKEDRAAFEWMQKDYFSKILSPEEIAFVQSYDKLNIPEEQRTNKVTDVMIKAMEDLALERHYSSIRDVLVEIYGNTNIFKKDFATYSKSMKDMESSLNVYNSEVEYLKNILSPDDIVFLKASLGITEANGEITSVLTAQMVQLLEAMAQDKGYSNIRDIVADYIGFEGLAKRDIAVYGQSMEDTSKYAAEIQSEKDYFTKVYSAEDIAYLKKVFGLADDASIEALYGAMRGRAKDRGYSEFRHVGVEIYGEDAVRVKEFKSGINRMSNEALETLSKDFQKAFNNSRFADNNLNELIALFKQDMSSEAYNRQVEKLTVDNIYDSIAFSEETISTLLRDYEEYNTLVAQGLIEKDEAYENAIATGLSAAGDNLSKAAEELEKAAERQRTMFDEGLTYTELYKTAIGQWTEADATAQSIDRLANLIMYSPRDYESIFNSQIEYESKRIEEMQSLIDQFTRIREKEIENLDKTIEKLSTIKAFENSYFSEINGYNDTLHSINKELASAKTKTEWFDAKTKELLFTEQDYLAVSAKIQDNLNDAENDRIKYEKMINNLEEDEMYRIQSITEEYEERVKLRQKELEILQSELDLQKKQTALNTALQERNVRVFSGGRWIQIANVENVAKAQEDLAETRYQIEKKNTELAQMESQNAKSKEIRDLSDQKGSLEYQISEIAEIFEDAQYELSKKTPLIATNLAEMGELVNQFTIDITNSRDRLKSFGYNKETKEEMDKAGLVAEDIYEVIYHIKTAAEDALSVGDTKLADYYSTLLDNTVRTFYGEEFKKGSLNWKNLGLDKNSKDWLTMKGLTESDLKYGYAQAAIEGFYNRIVENGFIVPNSIIYGLQSVNIDTSALQANKDSAFKNDFGLDKSYKEDIQSFLLESIEYKKKYNAAKTDAERKQHAQEAKGYRSIKISQINNSDFTEFANSIAGLSLAEVQNLYDKHFSEKMTKTEKSVRYKQTAAVDEIVNASKLMVYIAKKFYEREGATEEEKQLAAAMGSKARQALQAFGVTDLVELGIDSNAEAYRSVIEKSGVDEDVLNELETKLTTDAGGAAEEAYTIFSNSLDTYGSLVDGYGSMIHSFTEEQLGTTVENWSTYNEKVAELTNTILGLIKELKNSSSSEGGGSVSSPGGGGRTVQVGADGNAPAGTKVGDVVKTGGGDYLVVEKDTPGSTYNPASGLSSIKIDKNAAGTRDSQAGLSLVNEKGVELLSTKYGQLIELNPHQKIFNNDQLNYLYDMSREGLNGMNRTVNAISNTSQDNSLTINTLELKLDNVTDTQSFVEGLRNLNSYIKNTHTIQRR